ncbi:MAG: hypothetical protein JW789_01465 [Candidatus Aenigmarchaeota archaeon]|nr:hypothetical protein [Candidatus Aenigmarchaeota archaeon]
MKRLSIILILLACTGSADAETVQTFVSPDSSFEAVSGFIDDAESTLLISSYTFSSPEIAGMLREKSDDGVRITLMVEKSPAGGMSSYQESSLCILAESNITVMLYDGSLKYMHAKYIVKDSNEFLITSENFGYSGFFPDGTYGNRGWGAISDGPVASELAALFAEDISFSIPFTCTMDAYEPEEWNTKGAYSPLFGTVSFKNQKIRLIYSPDSLDEIVSLIESAEEYVIVQEFYIYTHWGSPSKDTTESSPSPVIAALLEKARSGVPVRVMLDSSYYNMEPEKSVSNYNTIGNLTEAAESEGIPIKAVPIDLSALGLAVLHNEGVIIDGKKVLVSSINWNENSIMNNRETGLIIEGEAAGYYMNVFGFDETGAPQENGFGAVPALMSLAAVSVIAFYFSRRKPSKVFL